MFKSKLKVSNKGINKYLKERVAFIGVKVGTFPERNQRHKLHESKTVITKRWGKLRVKTKIKSEITNAEVALDNIRGDLERKRLPRNYFAFAFSRKFNSKEKLGFLRKLYEKTSDLRATITKMGNLGVETVKRGIREFKVPANAKSTVEKKGNNNPLIESGQLLDSITYKPMHTRYIDKKTGEVRDL